MTLNDLKTLRESGKTGDALDHITSREGADTAGADLLIAKAFWIQLLNDDDLIERYSLQDAESALLGALRLEPENVEALVHLGYYYFAVQDKTEDALPLFEKAFEINCSRMQQAAAGIWKCLEETGSRRELRSRMDGLTEMAISAAHVEPPDGFDWSEGDEDRE